MQDYKKLTGVVLARSLVSSASDLVQSSKSSDSSDSTTAEDETLVGTVQFASFLSSRLLFFGPGVKIKDTEGELLLSFSLPSVPI